MEVQLRTQIKDEFKWDLSNIYKDLTQLTDDYDLISSNINEIKSFENKSKTEKEQPKNLKELLDIVSNTRRILSKMFVYVQRLYDQEQNNEESDILVQKVKELSINYSIASKFITNDIIHFDDVVIDNFMSCNELSEYHFYIKHILQQKRHILSKNEEELLSAISDVFSTSSDVYTVFKNTELKYSKLTKENGEEIILDDSNYREIRESNNRNDRKIAYDTFWKTYDDYKNTFTKLIYKHIKTISTENKIRKYDSSLESALSSDNIPLSIYNKLIENVTINLDKFHEYLNFRKNILKYDNLNYYDLYNPLIDNVDYKYSYDDAKKLLIESTKILGEEYTIIMTRAISERWIDVYPNKYKETGAYMSGSAYDVHPYILLNYNNKFNDVSTLSHELGHAGHSVLSNMNQTYNKSDYSIFIAEIASTTNEILLFDYMYNKTTDKQEKIFLLNNFIEHFRTTVFRQTMFAEFEKFTYESVDSNDMLTSSLMNNKYLELLKKYHGDVQIDELYANEWMFVPHFYYNFYVFQYSTSFISAIIIATKILNGDKDQLSKYLDLLKSGGKDYPIELLKKAGVDLTDEKCYDIAFTEFSKRLTELKNLIS